VGVRFMSASKGASWKPEQGRRLSWALRQLEPGEQEKQTFTFRVVMGGPGQNQFAAAAMAEGALRANEIRTTDVEGMAVVDFEITEPRKVVDVGDFTTYQIKIRNTGTKDATNLLVTATLSPNLRVSKTAGTETSAMSPQGHPEEVVFPKIPRLEAGKELPLKIEVEAVKEGQASCRVSLMHDELESKFDHAAVTRVTDTRRQ
jgi:uncharacterized repeat protein (TIGR01451 family)